MEYKDYYRILGVERTADEKAIKTAYRKLARKHHPDVAKDKGSVGRFQEITEAYEVLSDPEKRRRYDTLGSDWERQATGAGTGGRVRTPGGGERSLRDGRRRPRRLLRFLPEHIRRSRAAHRRAPGSGRVQDFRRGGLGDVDFGDLGDLGGRAGAETAGSDAEAVIELTLEEAFTACASPSPWRWTRCAPTCGGAGHVVASRVQTCRGTGWNKDRAPARGQDSRRRGHGRRASAWPARARRGSDGKKGDLYLRVTVKAHPRFERKGDDLYVDLPVAYHDAALGVETQIPTLKGNVSMKIPPETTTGRIFRLPGYGMPHLKGGKAPAISTCGFR